MAGPELAQALVEARRDGDFARLAILGLGNVDNEPLAVDVLGLDVKRFGKTQAALVDDGAVGAVTSVAEGP